MKYFLIVNDETIGPMTAPQLVAYDVNEQTPVSVDGLVWEPLYKYPELMYEYRSRISNMSPLSDVATKRMLCGILAILVGALGIHYFVLGKVKAGIFTILLSVITCGIWSVVMFIQGIMMLIMSDKEFKDTYIDTSSEFPIF